MNLFRCLGFLTAGSERESCEDRNGGKEFGFIHTNKYTLFPRTCQIVFLFSVFVFADPVGPNPDATFCKETESSAKEILNLYRSSCQAGGGTFTGGVGTHSGWWCVQGSVCNNCFQLLQNGAFQAAIDYCCRNDIKKEPKPSSSNLCQIPPNNVVNIGVAQAVVLPKETMCSNQPAGSGSNYCQKTPYEICSGFDNEALETCLCNNGVEEYCDEVDTSSASNESSSSGSGASSSGASSSGGGSSGGSAGSSSGSGGGSDRICRSSSEDLVEPLKQLILDCTSGDMNKGNTSTYSIEYFTDNSPNNFCITGRCVFPPASSDSGGGGSAGSSSGSGGGCSPYPLSSTPANPLNACFAINGKFYKCNPDRGSECGNSWLWNGDFNESNVGWWYEEVTSDGSPISSSSSSNSGGCTPYPLLSTPSDPLNACFAINGKCYKCNPDRGSDCGNSWLWNGDFNEGSVGWWYREVACGGESEVSNECQDMDLGDLPGTDEISFLFKKQNSDKNSTDEIYRNRVPIIKSKTFYDLLGRKTELDKNAMRFLVEKSTVYPYSNFLFKESAEYEINEEDYHCGGKGLDYGIIDKLTGQKAGGITCSYPVVEIYKEDINVKQEIIGLCADGCSKISIEGYVIATHKLKHNKPFYVEEGYKYSDGYIVTKEQENAIRKHEIGHQEDHARIVPNKQTTHNVSTIVCQNEREAKWKEWMDKLVKSIFSEYKKKIVESDSIYHHNYGNSGNKWDGYSP